VRRPVAAFACGGLTLRPEQINMEKSRSFIADQSGDRSPHSKERFVFEK
jgi:hypothetical protein